MTQSERIYVIMSLNDLTLAKWEKWLNSLTDAEMFALDADVNKAAFNIIYSLRNQEEPESQATYLQAIATLNDENLANLVKMVYDAQNK